MSTKVNWMSRVVDKVPENLIGQLTKELTITFPNAKQVTVYDCFHGYSADPDNKVVLGVEVRSEESYNTHVVKIGTRQAVESDYSGWRKCILNHNFASRIFVSVAKKELSKRRVAIIYQNAYTLFGTDPSVQSPQDLETVVSWAINDDKPDPVSVERVIRQIYDDLGQWFYRGSMPDADRVLLFYKRQLRRAVTSWSSEPWRVELRRDMIWLLCGQNPPDRVENLTYIDPYDYVLWALERKHFPQTLVGRSHGDLHGRNILVGVQRGEAEFPAVFDYGKMSNTNVLVWDFVKLETELKVRLLLPLYNDNNVCQVLLSRFRKRRHENVLPTREEPSAHAGQSTVPVERMAFAFEFESLLAELTDEIGKLVNVDVSGPPGGRNITGNEKIDRALAIFMRIRQEAALLLGARQPHRGQRRLWKDEYYFALAVYGLCTAKFDYQMFETEFALMSAGVAAARVNIARVEIQKQLATKPLHLPHHLRHPYPTYLVPLAHGHRLWKGPKTRADINLALKLLGHAVKCFAHAVPLLQEYALVLAEVDKHDEALDLLRPFQNMCKGFRDEETLSRIGRLCKNLGDKALENDLVPITELSGHPAVQWYHTAYERYSEAFQIRKGYYPGVNAATLALLLRLEDDVRNLAGEVLDVCGATSLGTLSLEDRAWILMTEGEASLLLRRGKKAASFYGQVLRTLHPEQTALAQSAYNQVCRLWWVLSGLGENKTVKPVIKVFQRCPFKLKHGPLGNCGLGRRTVGRQIAVRRSSKSRHAKSGRT